MNLPYVEVPSSIRAYVVERVAYCTTCIGHSILAYIHKKVLHMGMYRCAISERCLEL